MGTSLRSQLNGRRDIRFGWLLQEMWRAPVLYGPCCRGRTPKINLRNRRYTMYEIENKTKSLVTGNYSSFANCRTYIPRHLEEIWDFLRNIKICIYLFISRFPAEPVLVFCGSLAFRGTLVGKHCPILPTGSFLAPAET